METTKVKSEGRIRAKSKEQRAKGKEANVVTTETTLSADGGAVGYGTA